MDGDTNAGTATPPATSDDRDFGLDLSIFRVNEGGDLVFGDEVVRKKIDYNEPDPTKVAAEKRERNLLGKGTDDAEEAGREEGSEEADGREEGLLDKPEEKPKEEDKGKEQEEADSPALPEFKPEEFLLKANGEERTPKDKDELIRLAQFGLVFQQKNNELSDMRKAIEPFFHINARMQDDPKFLDYVRNYGNEEYVIDGPTPVTVSKTDFDALLEDRMAVRVAGEKIRWEHDSAVGSHEGYPSGAEVHQRMVQDSLHWDRHKREWVDANPHAYKEEFASTYRKIASERGLDPAPKRAEAPSQGDVDKAKALRESLATKEVSKEKARVEPAKMGREIRPDDGRLVLNKLRSRARATGTTEDWAAVIAQMGLAD